ncbi:hypothetical protein TeGR_g10017, partial [Tetraparma gracilis]
ISLALRRILAETAPKDDSAKGKLQAAANFLAGALPYLCFCCECLGTAGPATKNALYCVFEACGWTSMFAVAGFCAFVCRRNIKKMVDGAEGDLKDAKIFSNGLVLVACVYVPYMIIANIPLYYDQWKADQEAGAQYLSFKDGLPDLAICHESNNQDWDKWSDDAGWMVGYYGPAVWTSIWLMKAPLINKMGGGAGAGNVVGGGERLINVSML